MTATLLLLARRVSTWAPRFLVGLLFVWPALALATQTGSWALNDFDGVSTTSDDVTSVAVEVQTYEERTCPYFWCGTEERSDWSLGNNTLAAPSGGVYSTPMVGHPSLETTYNPGDTGSARITFTFSNPVRDPVLHVDRLGGQSSGTNTSAWTLNTGASNGAVSPSRLAGVDHFVVDAGGQRFRGSYNQGASGWNGECRTSASSGAACGSVRVNGTFTTLVFDVGMLGNAGSGDSVELAFTFKQDLASAASRYGLAIHALGENDTRYLGDRAPEGVPGEYADEDVIDTINFIKGETVVLPLTVHEPSPGSSYLNAWIDWNGNGLFENDERIAADVVDNGAADQDDDPGTVTLNVQAPADAASGSTTARFRWSSQPGLEPTGGASDGEVEDHSVNVVSTLQICDVEASDSLQLSGSASRDAGTREITLTPDEGNQAGSAWSENRISLLSPFSVEFSVYLGTKDASGADGIAFAFQNDPAGNSATGVFGGALGVGGLSPAVAVEFDTYNNGSGYGDIADDHTVIYNPENFTDATGGGSGSLYSSVVGLGNIEDGDWHEVRLNWDPASNRLQYFFDGTLTATVTKDFVNDVFLGDPNVFFGFAASTGGSTNLQKICVISAPSQVLVDYGDAPAGFGEPSHILGSDLVLGSDVSPDAMGYDDANAAADSFDDGVTFPGALPNLTPIEVAVSGDNGYLQAWVDWNDNGVFDEPQERIATDLQDEDGDGIILVTASPEGAVAAGDTYARFRWSSVQGLGPEEGAPDGEVEDYLVTSRSVSICETGSSTTGGGIASSGNGPYRDAIYWLDWNCLDKEIFQTSDVILKSWVFGPVEIRATLSDISAPLEPYTTGNWSGDLLDDLYGGVNPIGLSNASASSPSFRIDWQVYLEGSPIPAEIIVADAEDTDAGESLVAETNGAPWELFAVAPGTNDLQLRFENGGTRMVASTLPGINGVGSFLAMTQNVSTSRHELNNDGGQAMAFGVLVQKDHGDIAGGYPESGGHFASQVARDGGKPTTDTDINNISLATLEAPRPYLGLIPPGPEDADQNSANADADGPEEDGVVIPALVPGSNATLDITVTEAVPGQGYLQGWIDWNRDNGLDDAGEQVALNVRDNGPEDTNPVEGEIRLNVFVPPGALVGDTYARFRFSNTPDVPAGGLLVIGGEVEDYRVTVAPAVTAGPLSGRVFEDNGVGATAHDGQKGSDEPGLPDVPVILYHDVDDDGICTDSDPVLASTTTDGDGAWELVAELAAVGESACLVAVTPNGLLSVSENSGTAGAGIDTGAADDDVMTLTVPPTGTVWEGILFGDAGLPVLEPDQQGVVAPGGSRFYSHRFTARSAGSVDLVLEAPSTSPAAPAWNDALYRDDNCDGELDGADASLPLTAVNVQAGDQLCLLVKVFAPADAPVEALHSRPLAATQSYIGTAFQATARVTDTTRVAAGQLQLEKQVRNIGPDGIANTGDDVDAAGTTANQGAPGDVLRYRLIFRNQGSKALTEVIITDSTPAYSALNSAAACPGTLPATLSACTFSVADGSNGNGYKGSLEWRFAGELAPGAQGTVSYDVKIVD